MDKTISPEKLLELDSLIEFSQLINSKTDLKFILGNILLTIMGKMMISKGLIYLKPVDENDLSLEIAKGISDTSTGEKIPLKLPTEANFSISSFVNPPEIFSENKICFFFKIYFDGKLLGLLCLGEKIKSPDEQLTNREIIFIESLLSLSASAIENSIRYNKIMQLNSNLATKISQLNSLFEMSKEFNSNLLEADKIIRLLGYTLRGSFGVKDFHILNFTGDTYRFLTKSEFNFSDTEIKTLASVKKKSKSENISDKGIRENLSEKNIALIFPVFNHGKLSNIVFLSEKLNKHDFSEEDMNFLESVLNLSAISIDNAALVKEFLEKQKMEKELNVARDIQLALLPDELPEIKGYDLHALNIPAQFVGGDYYDVIRLNENEFAIVIADVSGKGMPASLLMANIQSAVHSFLRIYNESGFNLEEITSKLNSLIYDNTSADKFITFFWGVLNNRDHTFKYINAGHNPPYHLKGDEVNELTEGGLMIGVMKENIPYESREIILENNDVVFLFTDGVSEAKDKYNEEFSEENILKVLKKNKNLNSSEISNNLLSKIKEFTDDTNQFDDITTIVIKRKD